MGPQVIRLPDGQNFTVTPVFGGLFFKSHELNTHQTPFPAGWTIVIHTEDDDDDEANETPSQVASRLPPDDDDEDDDGDDGTKLALKQKKNHAHSFTKPTLQNDTLFISSISNPSTQDFKPAASHSRQVAMMVYVTLYWYFHQPAPSPFLPPTAASRNTPDAGRPKGDWRVSIKRGGVLRGRNLIPKLERMGLIASMNTAVGTEPEDSAGGWDDMYVSRRMFWQIPGRLFLFTLQPKARSAHSFPGSPVTSRPGSPVRKESPHRTTPISLTINDGPPTPTLASMPSFPIGPYFSGSHLPTYFPPGPLHYTMSDGVRHPVRPKPPRMGEVFYTRFVPSIGQYLSLRVASSSPRPVPYYGPVGPSPPEHGAHLSTLSDTALLQMWLAQPRVAKFWGNYVPDFLTSALNSKHSFPVIALWDGVPFGYFEIYWVKEDTLGRHIGGARADDFDRGWHVIIGEDWARGRVQAWVTSMAHYLFCADYRTMSVCIEPRVDNERFIQHLTHAGYSKDGEVSLAHKQAWLGRLKREAWEGPAL